MKFTKLLSAGALAALMLSPEGFAENTASATTMSDTQKKDIEKVVHDYLVKNPEVLLEASQALQMKQQQAMQQQAQSAIQEQAPHIFADKFTTLGNPKGQVTVVEFFDYQCIHCKKMAPVLSELIGKDKNVRLVYKEFPIFGKTSDTAARAALAAAMQNKYAVLHNALLKTDKKLTDDMIMDVAKKSGLNMSKLKADMNSKEVTEALEANRNLAEKLHLMGTPAFIVAATPNAEFKAGTKTVFIPGEISLDALQDLIKKANSKEASEG